MANELLNDHERGEIVKKWIGDNGGAIVMGIVLGVAGLFGYRYWEDYRLNARLQAASDYEQLVEELAQDASQATTARLGDFKLKHKNAAYQGLAALQLASKAVDDRNLEEAARLFLMATELAEPPALRNVAGLRLARVQLQAGLLDDALSTVDRFDDTGFESMAAQIRGDVLLARGDRAAARQAYQFALDNGANDRSLLQMKIDDLTPAAIAEAGEFTEISDTSDATETPEGSDVSDAPDVPEVADVSIEDANT